MKKEIVFAFLLTALIFVCGFDGCAEKEETEVMKEKCIDACKAALAEGQDLSAGSCLLDPIPNTEWVCDVAHSPREAVDNERENQCNAWHSGEARHFIEVTPECEFIKAI